MTKIAIIGGTWGDVLKVFNQNVNHVIDLLVNTIGKI